VCFLAPAAFFCSRTTHDDDEDPTEAGAIAAYEAAYPGSDKDQCLSLLATAAAAKSVSPELVEGALAFLERAGSSAGPQGACKAARCAGVRV
jgi:hypothetical protein